MIAPVEPAPDAAQRLLELAEELALEVRPGLKRGSLTLDSSLQNDLGIDSLARVELLLRIEKAFRTAVPESSAMAAETLRDLLRALERGKATGDGAAEMPTASASERLPEMPDHASTLVEVLQWYARHHPGRTHITLIEEGDHTQTITYGDLLREASEIAAGLRARDLQPAQPVALMLQTCREYFQAFYGVLLAGGVPVPLYPPAKATQIEEHVKRQAGILNSCLAPLMIASEEAKRPAGLVKSLAPTLRDVVTPAELRVPGAAPDPPPIRPGDTALLQYTSGSTGAPKGVTLSHANLLANIRGMQQASGICSTDVFVSWLPLYHDMGLIGAWLGSLYTGARAVLMSPMLFLARPPRWLKTMSRERGTITAAPNFAYDLCATKLSDRDVEGLDLSAWRLAFNGAEAVHPDTLDRFCERFAKSGFRRGSMTPVYGLAENCLGVTFPPQNRGPRFDRVKRDDFLRRRHAVPAEPGDPAALTFVGCGRPLHNMEVRIVDETGREAGEREHGRLEFRGPSSTGGYYRNPEATKGLFDGTWLDSGDLAYIADGEVFPAGRAKDLIIKGGRNIIPTEIEETVTAIPGVRRGCVAVVGVHDPKSGTERVVVIAETALKAPEERAALEKLISEAVAPLLEGPPDEIVLASPRTVPKTPSGKIRRGAARELYEKGAFHREPPGATAQFFHIVLAAAGPEIRRFAAATRARLYAAWCWLVFLGVALPCWLTTVLGPTLRFRRATMRAWMKLVFRLFAIPVRTTLDALPPDPCILAPNHQSYVDALVLTAALPPRFGFVVKRELARNLVLAPLLKRLGAVFVERFDPEQSLQDTEGVAAAIRAGRSLVIFPEGTFRREPGLLPFKMGAFVVAAQTGTPVVPILVRGTRDVLRDKTWAPRRRAVSVVAKEVINPVGTDWGAAVVVRDKVREALGG
ncbi:MAG: AMP-binding protein [Planctomycetes bacterium]|nr:AMP-binding protein [Planctomycetota bacterium]